MVASFDAAERRRLFEHGGAVLLVAGLCGIVGYVLAEFIAGVTGREIDSRAIAEHVAFYCGGVAIVVALLHLTFT